MNMPSLLKPIEIIDRNSNEPFASLHSLGWSFNGPVIRKANMYCYRISENYEEINSQLEKFFVQDLIDNSNEKNLSHDDRLWM